MAYTYVENTTFNKPNITVYDKLWDGVKDGYKLLPNEGYVLQNITEEQYPTPALDENGDFIYDENGDMVEIYLNHYYRIALIPLRSASAIDNFVAVAESSIPYPEDQIFGGGTTESDHEVM